ncbi:MAG: TAT-variant-translocated molybdopterin oxidoreductase, partial [Planctomycetales bacterium]|nr:TAT-variant-translocated molybdopterin oxidoreductase [Planctomycetales bacterium]
MQAKQLPVIKSDPSKQLPSSEAGKYWRSLSELEQTPEFEQFLHREFPQAASEFPSGVSRRRWLKLMSASLALSGAAGCRYGPNEFAAYVQRPENMTPGIAKLYATSFELAGRAVHLLVRNTEGRPIKVEGNAAHPLMRASEPNELGAEGEKSRFASGGTDVFSQGCVLGLYDPDRAHRVAKRSEGKLVDSTWGEFAEYAASHFETLKSKQGESHAILLSPTCSPSVKRLLSELVKTLPQARIALYSSIDRSSQVSAASQAAGQPAELLFNLGAAKVICCLDADLLGNDHNSVVYSRQFSKGREPIVGQMNRLYSVEARYSITGASADARLAVRSSQIGAFLGRLETRVDELLAGGNSTAFGSDEKPFDKIEASEQLVRMVESMAEDLVANKGAGLVAVGEFQPVEVHLAALRLNKKLGNNGHTVFLTSSRSHIEGVSSVALGDLVEDIEKGAITSLWVLGDNPAYTAPGDVKLGDALKKLDHAVYFAEFEDETAQCCSWSLPLAHPLEAWGDVTSIDGSYCVGQPQILPLLGGKSTVEILSLLAGHEGSGEEIVRETASAVLGEHVTSRTWREALHAGFVVSQSNVLDSEWTTEGEPQSSELDLEDFENGDLEINIVPSDTIYDGRFAKNVWLQELPQVMTKIVWDNAAIMSPATAKKLGVSHGLVVKLVKDNAALELPVFQMPGQADGTITLHLGYGRVCRDEAVNSNNEAVVGSDVSVLRSMSSLHLVTGVEARNTSRPYKLVTTQDHFAIDKLGMDETVKRAPTLVREGTLEQIQEYGSDYVEHHLGTHHPALESLWEE